MISSIIIFLWILKASFGIDLMECVMRELSLNEIGMVGGGVNPLLT